MKEYRGYFRSCDTSIDKNGQLFRVSIYTDFNNKTSILPYEIITLTDEPFTVEYEGEENNCQKPYKCSTATVNFLYPDFNWLFSETNNNNMLVVLSKWRNNNYYEGDGSSGYWYYSYDLVTGHQEGRVSHTTINDEYPADANLWETTWIGFGTPNTYNQSFEGVFDEVSINAQDALSTLKYNDYQSINTTKGIVSFSDIIKKYIRQLGTYRYVYVTDSVMARTEDFQDILHSLYVHENNFFDEDNEPMKVLEVIEQICQYLHITVIPYGDALYFVNYDGIENGNDDYYLWVTSDDDFSKFYVENPIYTLLTNKITLQDTHNILKDDFAENGTTLSVLDAFNKVTVKDDLYPIDSIIPEVENDKYYTNSLTADTLGPVADDRDMYMTDYSDLDITRLYTLYNDYEEMTLDTTTHDVMHTLFLKFKNFDNTKINADGSSTTIQTHWYPIDSYDSQTNGLTQNLTENTTINAQKKWNIETTLDYLGCCLVDYKEYSFEHIDDAEYDYDPHFSSIDTETAIAFFQRIPTAYAEDHRIENGRMVWFNSDPDKQSHTGYYPIYSVHTQPLLDITSRDVVMDKDTILKIEGTFWFCDGNVTVPFERTNNIDKNSKECPWIWVRMQVGDKYWSEESGWTTDESDFRLPIEYESNPEDHSNDKNAFYTDFKIISLVRPKKKDTYDNYYSIKAPVDDEKTHIEDVKFTIYRMPSLRYEAFSPLVLLKKFNISTKTINKVADVSLISKDNGSDTEYSQKNYASNYDKLEEYPNIDSKLSTWLKKYPNNSNVLLCPKFYENGYVEANSHSFLRLYTIYSKGLGNVYIPEDFKIQSIQNQYNTPTVSISLNLKESLGIKPWSTLTYKFFNGYKFIADSYTYDYRWNKHTINLVEKSYDIQDETVDDIN